MSVARKNFKICATCFQCNGFAGGEYVKAKEYSPNLLEFDPNEKQLCYRNHAKKAATSSCSKWQQKYS